MDEARARRLQPHYIELAFKAAFTRLGGRIAKREQGRYEIANVPAHVRAQQARPDRHQVRPRHLRPRARAAGRPGSAPTCSRPATRCTTRSWTRRSAAWAAPSTAAPSWSRSTLEEPHLLVGVVEEVADATGAVRRPALRLRLRRQLRHSQPGRPGAVPRLRRGTLTATRARRPAAAVARRRRGQGDELDHRQPAARVPRRGPAPPLAELGKARELVTKRLESESDRLLLDGAVAQEKERAGEKPKESSESLNRKAVELDIRRSASAWNCSTSSS